MDRQRPNGLPDFELPPLDEVVVGVQFDPPSEYSSIHTKDVWELFKNEFPKVQEQPQLEPTFETFGGVNPPPGINFKFGNGPLRCRYWFISDEQSHLIQFQEDRFLLNWRNRPKESEYPRFEKIAESFENNFSLLQSFYKKTFNVPLEINQAEVSYINIVNVDSYSELSEWIALSGLENIELEGLSVNFSEVIKDKDGKPFARLLHELQSVLTRDGKIKGFRFNLTFKGKPRGSEISDAMDFLFTGRSHIVNRFCELTTEKAHIAWERKQ